MGKPTLTGEPAEEGEDEPPAEPIPEWFTVFQVAERLKQEPWELEWAVQESPLMRSWFYRTIALMDAEGKAEAIRQKEADRKQQQANRM